MILELPYPPTVNTYWRMVGYKVLISARGREYRQRVEAAVWRACRGSPRRLAGEVELALDIYPPDGRRRDLDNCLKALFDGLKTAGVYRDDSQVKSLSVEWCEITPPAGKVVAEVKDRPPLRECPDGPQKLGTSSGEKEHACRR